MFAKLRLHAIDLKVLAVDTYFDMLARFTRESGVASTPVAQGRELVISLTTIPPRIKRIHLAIEGLLRQTLKPNRVALWLHPDDFPSLDDLPETLLKQKQRGLEIHHAEQNWPHAKLLDSLKKWPNSLIVTTDDDIVQPPTWLEELYTAYVREPNILHCHRARLIAADGKGSLETYLNWPFQGDELCHVSHRVVPTGVGGVLYFPGALHADVFNVDLAKALCPKADDLWFKIMAFKQGTQCKATKPVWIVPHVVKGSQEVTLMQHNLGRNANDTQFKAMMDHYRLEPAQFF
jgi:hypothetical protein